jgi:YgiT-type zinc finger domain-containing protein
MAKSPRVSSKSARPVGSTSSRSTGTDLCDACGKPGVEHRTVTRSFGRGVSLFVIEDIPLEACPHCGESYFSARTMHEIERIKALRGSIAEERSVPVAAFCMAVK